MIYYDYFPIRLKFNFSASSYNFFFVVLFNLNYVCIICFVYLVLLLLLKSMNIETTKVQLYSKRTRISLMISLWWFQLHDLILFYDKMIFFFLLLLLFFLNLILTNCMHWCRFQNIQLIELNGFVLFFFVCFILFLIPRGIF